MQTKLQNMTLQEQKKKGKKERKKRKTENRKENNSKQSEQNLPLSAVGCTHSGDEALLVYI
jgi:fatty acid-binding protein DegV